jgi:NDP-sugar pyrophosphorylase family protein
MKAMVLAAGLGTRLRPLTNDQPKALVEINGRTLLEIALARLRSFGVNEVIVNVHHFADRISEYLMARQNFGMRIEISRENELLDTGGGLKKAGWFFLEDCRDEPFLLHNVDVLSNIDLAQMVRCHDDHHALATLAVQERQSSRHLLFDQRGLLCGRRFEREQRTELARPTELLEAFAFCGIQVISPRLLGMMSETGAFSIVETYLHLSAREEKIVAVRVDGSYWRDVGTLESLTQAEKDFQKGLPHT